MYKVFILLTFLSTSIFSEDISFEQTIYVKTTKTKLWDALINPKTVSKYYMCPLKEIGQKEGDKIIYGPPQADFIVGEILIFKSQEVLSHSFKFNMENEANTSEATKVTYLIYEQNGLLGLTLVHEGFTEKNDSYRNITAGWPFILSNLKTYLETGKTLTEK